MRNANISLTFMKHVYRLIVTGALAILLFSSCTQKSEYQQMVEEGLNSGKIVNEIFLGYTFNMTREEFLELSWKMNQQEIITGGVNIVYLLEDLKSTVRLEFYPEFGKGVITKMPISASYISWAPWNEEYSAENLLNDMKAYYEKVYSTSFRNVSVPGIDGEAWVSVEGNREIRMFKKSVNTVQINFIDLSKAYENR